MKKKILFLLLMLLWVSKLAAQDTIKYYKHFTWVKYNTKEKLDFIIKSAFFYDQATKLNYLEQPCLSYEELKKFEAFEFNIEGMEESLFGYYILFLKISSKKYGKGVDFVLAIDVLSGQYFRLKNFNYNDFLPFFKHVSIYSWNENKTKLNKKIFLESFEDWGKDLGINFKCLYDSMKNNDFDQKKYPCLRDFDYVEEIVISCEDYAKRKKKEIRKSKKNK